MCRSLKAAGYRVLDCESGEQALETFSVRSAEIDVLVTDVLLPGVNGFEVAEEVMKQRPELPIVAMTGFVGEKGKAVQKLPREIPVLRKPFVASKLISTLRREIDRRGGESELAPTTAGEAVAPEASRKARVLIIDDNRSLQRAISRMLGVSFDVCVGGTLADAWAHIDGEEPVDVIVCDLHLDGESGLELYHALLERDPPLAGRLLLLTGGGVEASDEAALAELEGRVVRKPTSREVLTARVEEMLEGVTLD
jgi:DNA-binding NtrC family response regulator